MNAQPLTRADLDYVVDTLRGVYHPTPDILLPTIIGGVCWLIIAIEVLYVAKKLNGAGAPVRIWHWVYSAAFAVTGASGILAALPMIAVRYREGSAWIGAWALMALAVVYLIGQGKTTKMHNARNAAYQDLRAKANGLANHVRELSRTA